MDPITPKIVGKDGSGELQFLRLSDGHLPNIFISVAKNAVQIHINKKTRA
jgi:hypothetical protein